MFERLVRQSASLDMGGWRVDEVERATSALGWELMRPREYRGRVIPHFRQFAPHRGPEFGGGIVLADVSDPGQALRLSVGVVDLPDEGVRGTLDQLRAAWWIMEEVLGPPTMWGHGDSWMLWRRPGTSFLVKTHGGEVTFELLCTDRAAEAAGRADSRGSWCAAHPDDLSSAAPLRPAADWDEVQKQLARALGDLNHDAPFFPGGFIVHLKSALDPHGFVQCWNFDSNLVVEATAYWHRPESADPARLSGLGWELSHSMWKRRLPDTMNNPREHARTAARMLIDELRHVGVGLDDLVYSATMSGRGRDFHLDLPHLGLRRTDPAS